MKISTEVYRVSRSVGPLGYMYGTSLAPFLTDLYGDNLQKGPLRFCGFLLPLEVKRLG